MTAVPFWGITISYILLIQYGCFIFLRNSKLIHCWCNMADLPFLGMATLYIVDSIWKMFLFEEWQPNILLIQYGSCTLLLNGNLTYCWFITGAVPFWGITISYILLIQFESCAFLRKGNHYIVDSKWYLYHAKGWQPCLLLIKCESCTLLRNGTLKYCTALTFNQQ